MTQLTLSLNARRLELEAPPHWTLLRLLRDCGEAPEVRYGCGEGACGACAVLLDGVAVTACTVLAAQADGHEIVTSTSTGADHQLLQREFVARGAIQCGFCTSGMVIAGIEAVRSGRAGSRSDIRRSLVGNICRCTGYSPIVEAIEAFAQSKK